MFWTCLQDKNTSDLFLKVFSILQVSTDKYYLYANLSIGNFSISITDIYIKHSEKHWMKQFRIAVLMIKINSLSLVH